MCGFDFEDAIDQCLVECPRRIDDDCPIGQKCFNEIVCGTAAPTMTPTLPGHQKTPPVGSYSAYKRCGTDFKDADRKCGTFCPNGFDSDCPEGEYCYTGVYCDKLYPEPELRCGTSKSNAIQRCGSLCPTGLDDECADGEQCYEDVTCIVALMGPPIETEIFSQTESRCGTSIDDSCGSGCPGQSDGECDFDQYCFPTSYCPESLDESSAFSVFGSRAGTLIGLLMALAIVVQGM